MQTRETKNITYHLTERHIYGSARLGMDRTVVEMVPTTIQAYPLEPTIPATEESERYLGRKYYELSNHLGNVLTVITDEKRMVLNGSNYLHFESVVVSVTDYSPFGVSLTGRTFTTTEGYRYGFNGMESDPEHNSGAYDFGARIMDARLGRWMSVDPKSGLQAGWSTYKYGLDSPVVFIDKEGETEYIFNMVVNEKTGKATLTISTSRQIMCTGGVKRVESWYDLGTSHKEQSYKDYITVNVTTIKEDGAVVNKRYQETIGNVVDTDWYMEGVQDRPKGFIKFDYNEPPDIPQEVCFGIAFISDVASNGAVKADWSKNVIGSIAFSDLSAILKREGWMAKGFIPGEGSWNTLPKAGLKKWLETAKETVSTSQKVGEAILEGKELFKSKPADSIKICYDQHYLHSNGNGGMTERHTMGLPKDTVGGVVKGDPNKQVIKCETR